MASVMPLSLPGGLASITTSGTPLTNSTTSGRMFGARPGVAKGNCDTARKSFAEGVVPVNVVDAPIPTAVPPAEPGDRGAVEHQISRKPVGLQQPGTRRRRPQLCNRRIHPRIVQPRRAVRAGVDPEQRRAEPLLEKHVAVRRPVNVVEGLSLRPDQRLPPEQSKVLKKWSLDQFPLGGLMSRGHRPNAS